MRTPSSIEAGNVVQLGLARGGGLGLVGWGLFCGETSKNGYNHGLLAHLLEVTWSNVGISCLALPATPTDSA